MTLLTKEFFKQDAVEIAPKLLGLTFNRLTPSGKLKTGIIVETEAYMPNDPACHASKGITKRTLPMFKEGGICYVYLIYGMYHCLNVVTGAKGSGQAVLIRALELQSEEKSSKAASGPGKLCRHFEIDKQQNGLLFSKENGIWFERPSTFQNNIVETSSRIGISVGKEKEWRFYIKESFAVSKRK